MRLVRCAALPALLVLLLASSARADIVLPPLFGDGSVLQRGRPVPVWGTAEGGCHCSLSVDLCVVLRVVNSKTTRRCVGSSS